MLTIDEAIYAGGNNNIDNNTYYLYTNQSYWFGTPLSFSLLNSYVGYTTASGKIGGLYAYGSSGVRPVISISDSSQVESGGDGTATNPYVIKTN